MKKRILLIEKAGEAGAALAKAIGKSCDLFAVSNGEDALDACRTIGPFAVAVAEHGISDVSAVDLLKRVNDGWPETIGLLIAPEGDSDVSLRACREPHVFRCVTKPCDSGELLSAVDAALSRHEEVERVESFSEQLLFGKDSMESFNVLLEARVDRQNAGLRRLQRFSADLGTASSTREIASLTAAAASEVLSHRGVHVQLWEASSIGEDVGAGAGPEMSNAMHRAPIVIASREVGEVCVDLLGPQGEKLFASDVELLGSISTAAAIAVHHQIARRALDQAQHATILALARLAERRDMETGRHLERVAGYCRLVAEAMRSLELGQERITNVFIENLVSSSPLHDIGKVGIPDSILLKPGRLTPEEWEIMKTHTEIGGATLDSVIHGLSAPSFLTMGRDIAWCHHEKWDGSGYPRGLAGNDIPLSARIVAIADVYDALTTVRPYKRTWSHAEAHEWISTRAGSHFDPEVVAAFTARVEDADRIRSTLADTPAGQVQAPLEIAGSL